MRLFSVLRETREGRGLLGLGGVGGGFWRGKYGGKLMGEGEGLYGTALFSGGMLFFLVREMS